MTVSVAFALVVVELSVTDVGLTEQEMFAVALDGTAQSRLTVPVNPFVAEIATVVLPFWPMFAMVKEPGLACKVKLGPEAKPFHAVTRLNASMEPRPDA